MQKKKAARGRKPAAPKKGVEALMPVKVEGYDIKSWSLGQVTDLAPVFERIAIRAADRGVTMKTAMKSMGKVVPSVLPDAPLIIATTLGISLEEARDFELSKATVVILTIINLNIEYLKNVLGLVPETMKKLMTG